VRKLLVTGFSLLCFPLLAQVLQPLGKGLPSKVVASFAAGNEYLALFHDSSTIPAQHTVARWNGAYWSYFPGLKTPGIITGTNGEKYHFNSVVLYKDTMYVGAYIESPSDVLANVDHLYKWDGKAWVVMTNTISSKNYGIKAMTVFDGKMIVAGKFQNMLGMGVVDNIAAYNGNSWSFLGDSITKQGTDGEINALVVEGDRLYIGGNFQKFAGSVTGNLAYYTATNPTWGGIGSPFSRPVDGLASYNGTLAAISLGNITDPAEIRIFKNYSWSSAIDFSEYSLSEPLTIAGTNSYLLIGGNFVKNGGGANLLRYENDTLFATGNKISGNFTLGQRGSEAFIWGEFSESNTGIRYISKIEAYSGDVTGYLFYDKDQNCTMESTDPGLKNILVRFEGNSKIFFAMTNSDGKFVATLPEGIYSVSAFPGLHWINNCPTNYAVKVRKGKYSWLSLGQYMAPNTQDVELHLGAATSPTINAGDKIKYIITIKNTGNTILNGTTIHYNHNSRLVNFTSNPAADNYDASRYEATFTVLDLKPGETRTIEVFLNLPSDATAEEKFDCNLKAGSLFTASDANKEDNFDTLSLGVMQGKSGSVFKEGTSGDLVNISVTRLKYEVHFSNVSGEKVQRVVLMDSIDKTVQLRYMHVSTIFPPASWDIVNDILVVQYDNANLSAQELDPSQSNGYVTYYLELYKPLQHNDKVHNRATCDFDSKWFGTSNTVVVTMVDPNLGVKMLKPGELKVYPNPSFGTIHIEFLKNYTGEIVMTDNAGKVVKHWHSNSNEIALSTDGIEAGIYMLRTTVGAAMVTISK